MGRYLAILEVSQKQAFIFSSNKLKDNIRNSAIIEKVLSSEYIRETLKDEGYSDSENMVYSGGGHTLLEFDNATTAKKQIRILTEKIYREFRGLEVFAKLVEYDDSQNAKSNISNLISELEKKKSIRKSAFKQGTYGLEYIDTNTLSAKEADIVSLDEFDIEIERKTIEKKLHPEGYKIAKKFEDLGGEKNISNFIAVVHIDGNGMGKRVEEFYELIGDISWEETKKKLRQFSEGIANDFENAYRRMVNRVAKAIEQNSNGYFPIRRVITAGDDICFVTEGRIGIECARIFIEELTSETCINPIDGKGYSACAGVAIVHQKYPFYRAYQLAETLCRNAKKYGATISPEDNGRSISSIDWHIEFGELMDNLSDIRKVYLTEDGNRLEMRPYIINAPEMIMNDIKYSAKLYSNFKRIIMTVISRGKGYSTGKVKQLRSSLKEGENATRYYLQFNRMTNILVETGNEKADLSKLFSGTKTEKKIFIMQPDGVKRSILFDAIEILDTYIVMD